VTGTPKIHNSKDESGMMVLSVPVVRHVIKRGWGFDSRLGNTVDKLLAPMCLSHQQYNSVLA